MQSIGQSPPPSKMSDRAARAPRAVVRLLPDNIDRASTKEEVTHGLSAHSGRIKNQQKKESRRLDDRRRADDWRTAFLHAHSGRRGARAGEGRSYEGRGREEDR